MAARFEMRDAGVRSTGKPRSSSRYTSYIVSLVRELELMLGRFGHRSRPAFRFDAVIHVSSRDLGDHRLYPG